MYCAGYSRQEGSRLQNLQNLEAPHLENSPISRNSSLELPIVTAVVICRGEGWLGIVFLAVSSRHALRI